MKKLLITILFLIFSVSQARADFTPWIYPINYGSTYNSWGISSIDPFLASDTSYHTFSISPGTNNPYRQSFVFPLSNYFGMDVLGIEVEVRSKSNNAITWDTLHAAIKYSDSSILSDYLDSTVSATTSYHNYSSAWQTDTFYWTGDGDQYQPVKSYFRSNPLDGGFRLVLDESISGLNTANISIDYIKIRLFTEEYNPEVFIDNYTASASSQLVTLNMSGDTATKGANIKCEIKVFEDCTSEVLANYTSQTPVAKIILDPEYTEASSYKISSGIYQGYGYSQLSSLWFADNVEVPYSTGYICTYPTQTLCYEDTYYSNGTFHERVIHKDFHSDGTTSINFGQEVEPDDIVGKIIFRLKKLFIELFVPNEDFTADIVATNQNLLNAKAPFAYFMAASKINLTQITEATTFTFNIPVIIGEGEDGKEIIQAELPSEFSEVIVYVKWAFRFFIYGSLFMYAIKIPGRINGDS